MKACFVKAIFAICVGRVLDSFFLMNGAACVRLQEMKAFAKCIIEDTKSLIDVDMGIQMSIAGLYAQESVDKGSIPIEIPQF